MKRMLILGGNGFIGSNLADSFINKYEVFATHHINFNYNNDRVHYINVDLMNKVEVQSLFFKVQPDIVLHAAAVTTGSKDVIEKPYLHVTDNTIINALVFEACHISKVKHCIFFSCTVMYQSKDAPQSEQDWKISDELLKPYFGVANMKIYAERLCEFFSRLGITKYTAIRHSNVFGPRDKFDLDKCHVLPAMVRKVLEASNEIEIWGTGEAKRDLIYIDDLIDFVDKCIQLQTNPFELFNCGCGKAYSINEIIGTIQSIVKKESSNKKYRIDKPNIPTTLILNCEKANKILGWSPNTRFTDGIRKTIEWYQNSL